MAAPTRDQVVADRLAQAFAPALFADGLGAAIAAEQLLRDLPTAHPRRAAVAWRVLELRLPYDPAGVLAQLDAAPPPPADDDRHRRGLAIAAMIACGAYERAAAALAACGEDTAAVAVLRGQLALATGALDAADRHLAAARATATDPEDRAAALLWSLQLAARRGDRDAVATWAAALDELLAAHHAGTSRQMVALEAAVALAPDRGALLAPLFARHAEDARARLCAGIPEEQAALGPIPRHVHAAFRKLRDTPAALEAALLDVAGLQLRAQQVEEAMATVSYAARLAPRLLPPAAAARWREAVELLRAHLGPARCAEVDAYLRLREDTFARTMRRA